ncbi:MAG: saccharopine dehydrogenase C-terminal domain-containing protein [Thermoplasmatota archaeon]
MDALVIGGGKMGLAVAYDLLRHGVAVTVADADPACPAAGLDEAMFLQMDATDIAAVKRQMRRYDVAVSALPYDFNYMLAQAAVDAGVHFCDLGGNTDMVKRELMLHDAARDAGVTVVPDCGLSPGLTNVLGGYLIEAVDARGLHIRVGGLPQEPQPPLDYALVFSVHGLVNEYVGDARVLRNGRIATAEPLSGLESIEFEGFPILEAFTTAGGTSTLPDTYAGRVDMLDDKSIRYPGHRDKIRLLKDLGFFDGDARAMTEHLLQTALPSNVPDFVVARLTAAGDSTMTVEIRDFYDRETGLSAMMRTTGFPTSITAMMLAADEIPGPGSLPPERCVPPEPFIERLRERDIQIDIRTAG